jgi:D-alanyl-lipoteichoic acid acyltransferase DltB (MBOAT superfamily)
MFEKLLVLLGCAYILGWIKPGRSLILLAASALAVFWLQPETSPANLAFWLPAATLALSALTWFLTAAPESRSWKQNAPAALVLLAVILLVDLDHYFDSAQIFTVFAPRPLTLAVVLLMLALVFVVISITRGGRQPSNPQPSTVLRERIWLALALLTLVLAFVLIKSPALVDGVYGWLAQFSSSPESPASLAVRWLGFSYIAFRMIHTIRDRQSGRLPAVTLDEYVTYVVFFPALSAGPIDRLERFVPELRQPLPLTKDDWLFVIRRVFFGLFKKFVIADTLAISALNDSLAQHVHSAGWMWILVYAYAFQIYFDFSGYTDIAIGMARLMGIRLPENFSSPYLKPNLTQFWNNWHITLTQWFRAYTFNPLTRSLRRTRLPVWMILLVTQVSTMVLIGLWHGIAWTYTLWGLWHGLGLFVHNRWVEWSRTRQPPAAFSPFKQTLLTLGGILLTFHFVALGWVFFALSTPAAAWRVLLVLFGLST